MSAIPKQDRIERQRAVVRYFREHPTATVQACQEALKAGRITATAGHSMRKSKIYALRREALAELPAAPQALAAAGMDAIELVLPTGARFRFPASIAPSTMAEYTRSLHAVGLA